MVCAEGCECPTEAVPRDEEPVHSRDMSKLTNTETETETETETDKCITNLYALGLLSMRSFTARSKGARTDSNARMKPAWTFGLCGQKRRTPTMKFSGKVSILFRYFFHAF